MTDILIAVIGSSATAAIISGIFSLAKGRRRKHDGVTTGVRQLLYDRIKYLGRCYIDRKEISSEDLEDIIEMHRIYHDDLDGNGYLDSLMDAVKKLPIIR